MIATIINIHALVKMMYSSLLAGVAVAVVFSIAILGLTRSSEMRRAQRSTASAAYTAVGTVALLLAVAIVIYGLTLVAHKS